MTTDAETTEQASTDDDGGETVEPPVRTVHRGQSLSKSLALLKHLSVYVGDVMLLLALGSTAAWLCFVANYLSDATGNTIVYTSALSVAFTVALLVTGRMEPEQNTLGMARRLLRGLAIWGVKSTARRALLIGVCAAVAGAAYRWGYQRVVEYTVSCRMADALTVHGERLKCQPDKMLKIWSLHPLPEPATKEMRCHWDGQLLDAGMTLAVPNALTCNNPCPSGVTFKDKACHPPPPIASVPPPDPSPKPGPAPSETLPAQAPAPSRSPTSNPKPKPADASPGSSAQADDCQTYRNALATLKQLTGSEHSRDCSAGSLTEKNKRDECDGAVQIAKAYAPKCPP